MNTEVAGILELSVTDRLRIVEDIWDSIAADAAELPLSDDLREELDRRLANYEKNPDEGVSFDELHDRLLRSR